MPVTLDILINLYIRGMLIQRTLFFWSLTTYRRSKKLTFRAPGVQKLQRYRGFLHMNSIWSRSFSDTQFVCMSCTALATYTICVPVILYRNKILGIRSILQQGKCNAHNKWKNGTYYNLLLRIFLTESSPFCGACVRDWIERSQFVFLSHHIFFYVM